MTEWFQQRYISRDEHREIVAYYKKLVAQLHCNIRDLKTEQDAQAVAKLFEHGRRLAERHNSQPQPAVENENVIAVNFRERRKSAHDTASPV